MNDNTRIFQIQYPGILKFRKEGCQSIFVSTELATPLGNIKRGLKSIHIENHPFFNSNLSCYDFSRFLTKKKLGKKQRELQKNFNKNSQKHIKKKNAFEISSFELKELTP